ncbi:hypothetical protein PoB_007087800 [Plakobranchus ocellatus]|uniref:Uncharacterized protein n=1 Tax=Plakobranchus ocellatus TaxID=259542 RepID=A0AAV4DJB2_9GAST|nr:hypothetical protein PoB_007087800 [Plakobranchus ocellatus]
MSISKTGAINVRLFKSGRPSAMLPWSHAHCPIPHHNNLSIPSELEGSANAESDQQDVCSVTCQGRYFKAQSDGLCKTQHSALLAIADDGSSPLCPAAMRGLANFLMCGLKSQVETLSHADLKSQSVSVMFDASTNKKLYVVEINLALLSITDQIFSFLRGDAIRNIYHVALLMKSFENYRSSRVLCSRQNLSDQNSALRVIHTSSIESYLHKIKSDIALSEGMEELRGPIVDRQNTTTVCLTTVHIAKNVKPDYLYCMEDPVRERDTTLLHGFRNSPCFSLVKNLEVPRGSNGAVIVMKSTGSFLMWTILIIVLVKATQLP